MAGKPSKSKRPIEDRTSRRKRGPGVPLPDMPTRLPRTFEFWAGSRRHLVVDEVTKAPWERRACGIVPPDKRSKKYPVTVSVEAPIFRDPRYCRPCFARYIADDEARRRKIAQEPKFPMIRQSFIPDVALDEPGPVRSRVG